MAAVISNHRQQAQERLLEQDQHRPKLSGFLSSIIDPLQEIENESAELKRKRWLDEAEGLQLDHLGEMAGEERSNRCDEEYRTAIYARIFINRGGGTPEDIIAALNLVYKPESLKYSELYPASFKVYVQGYDRLGGIKKFVESIKPIGVNAVITHLRESKPFTFSNCSIENVCLTLTSEGGRFELCVQEDDDASEQHILEVAVDTIVLPENGLGFGELILTESNLDVEGDIYMVDDNTELVLIASLEDFKVQGGGRLAGVIAND